MLTKLSIRNFKRFDKVDIELGSPVVLIGPNNSGKTSAMQALTLWHIGLRRWNEARRRWNEARDPLAKAALLAAQGPHGAAINRRGLVAIPVPQTRLLWRDLKVRALSRLGPPGVPLSALADIRIDLTVEGVTSGRRWTCGLEFTFANEESLYCQPLRLADVDNPERIPVPEEAAGVRVAFLPPISGLAAAETRLDRGAINVRIGEGRTAEVLRNLCFRVRENQPSRWEEIVKRTHSLFRVELGTPQYISERGEIAMTYRERGTQFDLSASGRGLQQTLLLLAYMYANPGAALLLDEPDAHLETLRQRQIYRLLTEVAGETGSQIIAASHSEVLLDEAARQDMVVAFVGKPHSVRRGSQVRKALKEIPFDDYFQAEQAGWVLYLEGSTDLSMLQAFAKRLGHEAAQEALERPAVHYVANQVTTVQRHYHGLREALPGLGGVALFDRLGREPLDISPAKLLMWKRREFENYLCSRATLEAYAAASAPEDSSGSGSTATERDRRVWAMRDAIEEIESAMKKLGKGSPRDGDVKASDDFLDPLFAEYFQKLGLPNLMAKSNYHQLARYVPGDEVDPEITEKLDAIAAVAESANPAGEPD